MPAGGADHRSAQMGLLAGLHHERATDPKLGELLAVVESSDLVAEPTSPAAVNTRELRRSYNRRIRLPRTLVEELARTTSLAQPEWVTARTTCDFVRFRPWLEKIIQLKRDESACLATETATAGKPAGLTRRTKTSAHLPLPASRSAYDPLLDDYEPGANSHELATLFHALRSELVPLVATISDRCRRLQSWRSERRLESTTWGRPFCDLDPLLSPRPPASLRRGGGRGGRLRLPARPAGRNRPPVLLGHRAGRLPHHHALSTNTISATPSSASSTRSATVSTSRASTPSHYGTPMGEAVSLGIHESQSRLWENAVARSRPFWAYWFPMARRIFHEALADVTLDEFHAAVNHVGPSLIRVQADEVDLQPAHHRPLRARAGTALRRPGRCRPTGGLEPEIPRGPRRYSPTMTPRAASKTSTGAPGLSVISRLTPWVISTRPSSSPRPRPISAASMQAFAHGDYQRPARLAASEGPSRGPAPSPGGIDRTHHRLASPTTAL